MGFRPAPRKGLTLTKFLSEADADRRLDRFELIAELASGGMATVYLARLSGAGGFQRFVAIKRLHPHLANDQDFIQMFLDEARLAARLHHPNVVPIVEIGESPEGYYLVMEYIEGDTLARLLARSVQAGKSLPAKAGIRILLDTLAGLHAAHELLDDDGKPLKIVHRDVSPQNILVSVDGSARITDFGVARAASRLSTTRTGQLKGKLAYMAPEQARGKDVDRRADIFAMGIVVWETLAQRRLFKGEGEADTLNRVLYEPIPLLRSANPMMPQQLEELCSKALERDPDKRFDTCLDFAEALEKVARSVGVHGSHKDVQSQLTAVMGTDISQQRDAVRAWLSRSEPSRPHDPRIDRPVPASPSSPSNVSKVVSTVEGRAPTSSPSRPAPGVSSVSSAVMELPPGLAEPRIAAEVPTSRPRSRAWMPIAVVALLLLGGASFYVLKLRGDRPVIATAGTATTPIVVPLSASVAVTPLVSPTPVPSASATVAVSATSIAIPPSTSHVFHPRPTGRPANPTTTPATTASTNAVPDDISKNPYR